MPLTIVETLEELPEDRRSLAVELKDGRFGLAEDVDVTPLKSKADELLRETKQERQKRKALEDRLAQIEAEKNAAAAGLTKEKLDEIMQQAEAKYRPVMDELEKTKSALRSERLDGRVKAILGQARAADIEAAFKVVGDHFDLTEDGALVVKVDPTISVEDYITKSLTTKYPFLFQGTLASGGGASGTRSGAAGGLNAKPITSWSSDERAAFIESQGIEAFQTRLAQEQVAAFSKRQTAASV
jgi:hypothetical protein